MMRPVAIANRHPRLRLDRRAVARVIHTLDARAAKFRGGPPPGELSLVFLTDTALARLHADFLADPAPTDVITFEGDSAAGLAGEICISADAARRHLSVAHSPALNSRSSALDSRLSSELTLYLVHGWLHLAGYDDLVPTKKRAMRRAEARAMKLIRAAGVVPYFTLRPK
jgi:probable rRNA maturation factor